MPPKSSVPASREGTAGTEPTIIRIVVYGTPAPQGSKRHVGNGIMVESSKKVVPWREAVKHAWLAHDRSRFAPAEGPLLLSVTFTLKRPVSAPKRRLWPDRRPDLDKLLRSTFDALGDAGAWYDDAQVVSVCAVKTYAGFPGSLPSPGAVIDIEPAP